MQRRRVSCFDFHRMRVALNVFSDLQFNGAWKYKCKSSLKTVDKDNDGFTTISQRGGYLFKINIKCLYDVYEACNY